MNANQTAETTQAIEATYVDYRGAEKITGLSRWTLGRAVDRGELRPRRVGASVRFSVAELKDWLDSHQ